MCLEGGGLEEYDLGKTIGSNIGNSGYCADEVMKLAVKMSLRKWSGGSAVSAHKLSLGLVRKAPMASLRDEV